MKTIWKYEFEVNDNFILSMPMRAKVLHIECQGRTPCIWAIGDPSAEKTKRKFRVVGTGHPISDDTLLSFVGTFQQPPFVWHVFEVL